MEHNDASRRVFEKCGFVFEKMVSDMIEMPESKIGEKVRKVGLGIMRWEGVGVVELEVERHLRSLMATQHEV